MKDWPDSTNPLRFTEQPLDPARFQAFVLSVLERQFPDKKFLAGEDVRVVFLGEAQLGLQSVYTAYKRDLPAKRELTELIVEHFKRMIANVGLALPDASTWQEAELLVRPQFMPVEYADQIPLIARPFHSDISIGFVIDREAAYSYVRAEDFERWGVSEDALYEQSLVNLGRATEGISITGGDGFLGVETKDGYDAARILLPSLREYAAQTLGTPFFAAFPNRDFLIMWSRNSAAEFQELAREKVRLDFGQQPYPLTPDVFRVTVDAIVPAHVM
ncbi:MAG TPA: DUF1444 family protein [Blastocatellia bacterium]|nr:DUF1444 family protein [Blastocatellia bacterium]